MRILLLFLLVILYGCEYSKPKKLTRQKDLLNTSIAEQKKRNTAIRDSLQSLVAETREACISKEGKLGLLKKKNNAIDDKYMELVDSAYYWESELKTLKYDIAGDSLIPYDTSFWVGLPSVYDWKFFKKSLKVGAIPLPMSFEFRQILDLQSDLSRENYLATVDSSYADNLVSLEELRECKYPHYIYQLYKGRDKIWYLLYLSDYPRIKDVADRGAIPFDSTRLYKPLLKEVRTIKNLSGFVKRNKSLIDSLFDIERFVPQDMKAILWALKEYHGKVTQTYNWEGHFQSLIEKDSGITFDETYHDLGFPQPCDSCMNIGFGGMGHPYGWDYGLEGWLYGFWVRRYSEGTMAQTYELLTWVLNAEE